MTHDDNYVAALWSHCIRFGSPEEVVEAIGQAGAQAGELLGQVPMGGASRDREAFDILWSRIKSEKNDEPERWARVARAMSVAKGRVNSRLPDGALPLPEMIGWGAPFDGACEAFVQAGANCWKKSFLRVNAVDAARRRGELETLPWLRHAMATHDKLDSDNAKTDLMHDDVDFGGKPASCDMWAKRFERQPSAFDLRCAEILAERFSPSQALNAWIAVRSADGLDRDDLARWTIQVVREALRTDLAQASDLREVIEPLCGEGFSARLGQAALALGKSDGSSQDERGSAELIEALMEACDACQVDFEPAAQVFAKQAISWKLPSQFSADPYAKAFLGEQLLSSLNRARALWEAKAIDRAAASPSPTSRSPRL